MPLANQGYYDLLNHLGSYMKYYAEILCSFTLVLKRKSGKEIREPSRLQFLEKFSANTFALSDPGDNTSGLLNGGCIADLPLLRTPLAICQKF